LAFYTLGSNDNFVCHYFIGLIGEILPRTGALTRKKQATLAVPGDLDALTGGYIYEKQLLLALRRAGWDVAHLALPGGFPTPSLATVDAVAAAFATLPEDVPVLLDGFLPGATPPEAFAALRAPFVAITHHPLGYETGLDPERAAYLCEVERTNLARATRVVVPSPHTAQVLASDFDVPSKKITVALPGVRRPEPVSIARADPPLILCVGQLVPRKGQDVLLEALARIRHLDWQARLLGYIADDDFAQSLRQQAKALGLEDRVDFAGEVPSETLARHYAEATVFALPTRYEGYGMVFAEALVHGLPIVSCAVGAVPDTVPSDAGILVSEGDTEAFAAALETLLTDEDQRRAMQTAAARHGRALPTWDDTAALVAQVLQSVVA